MTPIYLLSSLVILSFIPSSVYAASTISINIRNDNRRVIDLGTFGFGSSGIVRMNISGFSLLKGEPYIDADGRVGPLDENIGFVIDKVPSAVAARVEKSYASMNALNRRVCFIDDPTLVPNVLEARRIIKLNGALAEDLKKGFTFQRNIIVKGLYGVFFFNCRGYNNTENSDSSLKKIQVNFDVKFQMINIDSSGKPSYLPIGEQYLPLMFLIFAIIFLLLSAAWVNVILINRALASKIHYMMLFLVIMKAISLFFESTKYYHYSVSGESSMWNVFFYVSLTIKSISLFSALILLGSGWSIAKFYLSDMDRKLLLIILPCQIMIHIIMAGLEAVSEGNKAWLFMQDILHILDLICCCCVILPLIWSVRKLQKVSATDDKAQFVVGQVKLLHQVYFVVVVYIYVSRIIVTIVESMVSFEYVWVGYMLRELIAIALYVFYGITFRPMEGSTYSRVSTEMTEITRRREMGDV
eukprot:Tbor_TRINITY_DN5168_c0_g2::TRINITY_DN5168_c0_g2_i2::g.25610::m.25610